MLLSIKWIHLLEANYYILKCWTRKIDILKNRPKKVQCNDLTQLTYFMYMVTQLKVRGTILPVPRIRGSGSSVGYAGGSSGYTPLIQKLFKRQKINPYFIFQKLPGTGIFFSLCFSSLDFYWNLRTRDITIEPERLVRKSSSSQKNYLCVCQFSFLSLL